MCPNKTQTCEFKVHDDIPPLFVSFRKSIQRFYGSCNTFDNLSERLRFQSKIGNANVKVFNVIFTKIELFR